MNIKKIIYSAGFSAVLKTAVSLILIFAAINFSTPFAEFLSQGTLKIYPLKTDNISFSEANDDLHETLAEEDSTEEKATEKTETDDKVIQPYETPGDILEAQEEYLSCYSGKIAGTTEEVFFRTSGATDSVEGIHIKNTTSTKKPDFAALIKEGPALEISDKAEPCVLIFHTHTTESYLLADTGNFYEDYETRSMENSMNMVRVGDEICKVLELNGIGYIHDTNIYDESYNGAYSRSRVTVEKYLKEYPSIKIVLDVHRDAIYYSDTSHCKPTAEINGRKAAQIMIITGAEEGYITDFPHWEDNLKFALCFQKTAEEIFPGLMKPLYFCQRKYNMDTAKCSLLLEIGTDANTLDEAMYSGHLAGQVISKIIGEYSNE